MGRATKTTGSANWPEGDCPAARRVLDRPLSGVLCFASWVIATGLFFGMIALLGGPSEADASESIYTTWAIAHGDMACAYAPNAAVTQSYLPEYRVGPHTAPLWPLVSGGLAAVARIGHEVPFPTAHDLGSGCATAYGAMYDWTQTVRVMLPTIGMGYAAWFSLLAGVIALLRAMGRGRSVWEAAGVILVGLSPVVWMPVLDYYHPEDLLAVGLILGGVACFRRRRWGWAGLLLGLAVSSQQFALLALVPLVVVAPAIGRRRLVVSSAFSWAVVALPMVVVTSGRALGSVVFGTGDASTFGGTVLWETGLRDDPLTFCSRVVPLIVAAVFAWWVGRRLGARVLDPAPLLSLVATCLSLRLVFEKGLFGYKFMALAVLLVLLAVVRRRISGPLVAWLLLVSLAFNPVPVGLVVNARSWGSSAASKFDWFTIAAILALIVWDASRRVVRWYLVGALILAVCAFWHLRPVTQLEHAPLPLWLWQVALVGSGVVMAVDPLWALLRRHPAEEVSSPPAWAFVPAFAGGVGGAARRGEGLVSGRG